MNLSFSALSLLVYTLFAYYYWIFHSVKTSALILGAFLVLSLVVRPLRVGIPFLVTIGLTHALFLGIQTSVYLQWPLDFYLMSGVGFLVLKFACKNNLSRQLKWSFKFTKQQWASIFIINVPATLVLIWYYLSHREIAQLWQLPELPFWSLPIVILLIAAINGLREEIYYRGLLQTLTIETYPVWFVIALQAVFFGSLHFINSFPQGWLGVGLTALWGAAIAIQYQMYRSIALAWLTHAIADAVMFSIIIWVK